MVVGGWCHGRIDALPSQSIQARDKFVSFDTLDQSDDTFYAVSSWCRYVNATGDAAMEADFYELLANYSLHYFAPGARSLGFGGTPDAPERVRLLLLFVVVVFLCTRTRCAR